MRTVIVAYNFLKEVAEILRKDGYNVEVNEGEISSISVHKVDYPLAKSGYINITYDQGKFWIMGHKRVYKLDEPESSTSPLSPKGVDCDFIEFAVEMLDNSVKARLVEFLR